MDTTPAEAVDNWITVTHEVTPAPGETVTVVYRPGIVGEQEVAIGITDARGRVRWSPSRGGVATVHAGQQQLTLRVGRSSPPSSVLTLLSLLTLLAIGSGAFGFRKRTRSTSI